ncbi:hypothetical protein L0Y49_02120, partial [bacterium]|nr:hypothetical protein [bacterium]
MKMRLLKKETSQKIALFLAVALLLPLPINNGLEAGYAPLIPWGLFSLGFMAASSFIYGEINYFLFFGGELLGLLLLNYFAGWLVHWLLLKYAKREGMGDEVPWLHI